MEKIKIKSISKSEFRNCYYFNKDQEFFEFIRNFLIDLGFEMFQVNDFGRPIDSSTAEAILNKEEKIEDYVGRVDNFRNEIYSIDIIPFNDRIVVIINSREDKQQEIAKILEKYIE